MQLGRRPPSRVRASATAFVCGALLVTSCSGSDESAVVRQTDIRIAVLRAVVEVEAGPAQEAIDWVLFVESGDDDETIELEEQIEIVNALADVVDVRFVDESDEAIDDASEVRAVIDGGLLVRLGNIADSGSSVDVYVESYRSDDDRHAVEMTASRQGGDWVADGPGTPTELR